MMDEKVYRNLERLFDNREFTVQDIKFIYDKYLEASVKDWRDLFADHKDFENYVLSKEDHFNFDNIFERVNFKKWIHGGWIGNTYIDPMIKRQEDFAKDVVKKVGDPKGVRFAEVGCGAIPIASMILAKECGMDGSVGKVIAIDPALKQGASYLTLKNLGVDSVCVPFEGKNVMDKDTLFLNGRREGRTPINFSQDVDCIIANNSCQAIAPIVELCSKTPISAIVHFSATCHPDEVCKISSNCPMPEEGWKNYFNEQGWQVRNSKHCASYGIEK